jgi:hypothetical protein
MAITLGGTAVAFASAASTSLTTGNLSSTPVSGSVILVRVSTGDTNNGATSVTDNVAGSPNTFTLVSGSNFYNNGYRVEIWQCTNITGGASYQVTANWAGSMPERHLTVVEVKGAATSSAIDLVGGQALSSPGTGANAVTTGSLGTPSSDGQFVFAAFGVDNGGISPSVGSGFTQIGTWDPFGASGQFLAEYLIQTTATAVAGTFTTDVGTEAWVVAAVTVKASAAAATLEQEGFRWYNDDGSESASTAFAAQDTNITAASSTTKRLRMLVNATGDPATKAYKLQYRIAAGSWADVL